jgi:predicted HNH restriction endonuclease
MANRIQEKQLILPALYCIKNSPQNFLSTSDLIAQLREMLHPSREDIAPLKDRGDDKFSQKVRNLRSHKTLEQYEFCTYEHRGNNGYWSITAKGISYLEKNEAFLNYLIVNSFDYADTIEALEAVTNPNETNEANFVLIDEETEIFEGLEAEVKQKIRIRSKTLREKALRHYTIDDKIACQACGFDFEKVYGEHGKGFIEIHHIKPIFSYDEAGVTKAIEEALKDVIPLCANCHRMIHRRKERMLTLDELRKIIAAQL